MNWQPIETAPKDGTAVLFYRGLSKQGCDWCMWVAHYSVEDQFWCDGEGRWTMGTHWMPLPLPPKEAKP